MRVASNVLAPFHARALWTIENKVRSNGFIEQAAASRIQCCQLWILCSTMPVERTVYPTTEDGESDIFKNHKRVHTLHQCPPDMPLPPQYCLRSHPQRPADAREIRSATGSSNCDFLVSHHNHIIINTPLPSRDLRCP
jgi:hypothetical protein